MVAGNTIKLFATLQLKTGIRELRWNGPPEPTMDGIIDFIQEKVTASGKDLDVRSELLFEDGGIRPGTMLLIDGKNVIHADALQTTIPGGASVSIFPPAGGG